MIDEYSNIFKEEAKELVEELETSLLELEKNKSDVELVRKIFRALHTIKGSGGMFGFEDLSEFAHELENVFDLVRDRKIVVTKEMIDLGLNSLDIIKKMLENGSTATDVKQSARNIVEAIRKYDPNFQNRQINPEVVETVEDIKNNIEPINLPTHDDPAVKIEIPPDKNITYRIQFEPTFKNGDTKPNINYIFDEITKMGRCTAVAQVKNIPPLEELIPRSFYVYWDIILTTTRNIDEIKDAFIFMDYESQVNIEIIDDGSIEGDDPDYKKLGNILIERGDLKIEQIEETLKTQKKLGEILLEKGLVGSADVESALIEQEHIRTIRKNRLNEESHTVLKVSSERADKLVDLVGELVTMQARLSQAALRLNQPELSAISEEAERLISDIRDNTMSIRMLPIGTHFSKFNRLVRDFSQELNKEVELLSEGGETELDKTVIERLTDPILHILRYTIEHGIESPFEREKIGKPRKGTIRLTASYSGSDVIITFEDDGAGIPLQHLKAKAIENGWMKPGETIPDTSLYAMLFEPGFSVSQASLATSGKGMGLDTVKKNIESLRGTIQITQREEFGTRIKLQMPLTLAIIEGLLVSINETFFIIPLSTVEEIVELNTNSGMKEQSRQIIDIRGKILPYIVLKDYFAIEGEPISNPQVVVVAVGDKKIGLTIDRVIGNHQTVIKSLGNSFRNVETISGATILGDGTIALIIDVLKLIQQIEYKEIEKKYLK